MGSSPADALEHHIDDSLPVGDKSLSTDEIVQDRTNVGAIKSVLHFKVSLDTLANHRV